MNKKNLKKIKIASVDSNFEREPLTRPFGFKGGYLSELWQGISLLQSASGIKKVGLSTQSTLWSDAAVFASHSESGGNALMYAITEYALQLIKGESFRTPIELQNRILDDVYAYGKKIIGEGNLRETFILNALVSVDNAAWMLYAAENGITKFDDMVPEKYQQAFSLHHKKIAGIPLISYNTPRKEIMRLVDSGYFFLKIKIGQPGTQAEMLSKDKNRVSMIHEVIGHYSTPHTDSGKLFYYFDANGRYQDKGTLLKLIDHLDRIDALEQTAIIEEPFPEDKEIDVWDIPVRISADECAHTAQDVLERIEMGYKAIALKPIAKTLSMTMGMAKIAQENGVPCFCADLTVNPILVNWNKNVAARLEAFPGLNNIGLLESNGEQNYKDWAKMEGYRPYPYAGWNKIRDGLYTLNENFYKKSGGILTDSECYMELFDVGHDEH